MSSSTAAAATPYARGPLFLLAGCHGSLHWVLATFYVLLPFMQQSLGLSYAEAGLLASTVHFASFAANVPSGAVVDMTGRRVACQLVSLVCASIAVLGLAVTDEFWLVALCVGLLAAMNTLWHPAAISYLSDQYREQPGLARDDAEMATDTDVGGGRLRVIPVTEHIDLQERDRTAVDDTAHAATFEPEIRLVRQSVEIQNT